MKGNSNSEIEGVRKGLEEENQVLKSILVNLKQKLRQTSLSDHRNTNEYNSLKEKLELYESCERLANVGGWTLDITNGTWNISKNWMKIHGLPEKTHSTMNLMTLLSPLEHQLYLNTIKEVVSSKKTVKREHTIKNIDTQEERTILLVCEPIFNKPGEVVKLKGIVRDVSERKESVKKLNASLDEICKINQELEELKSKAEECEKVKSAFLATINHELKTPLNHILGFSDVIAEMSSDENIRKFAAIIKKSGTGLLTIIEDIFSLAMLEQNEIIVRKNELCIRDLFEELKAELDEVLNESQKNNLIHAEYCVDESLLPLNILADRPKVSQVMSNLIRNAVKYTRKGKIKLLLEKPSKNELSIRISDTGIGIPKDKQKLIFDLFRQGDISNSRKYEGVGIGLAISQKIALVIGGEIRVSSVPEMGSEFSFRFPAEFTETTEPDTDKDQSVRSLLKNKKVLIAEDDLISMELLSEVLRETECEVFKAENGIEAVELCKKHKDFSLILMDIKMPFMDGDTATREIKKTRPDLPVLAITAYITDLEKEKYLMAGCSDVLRKPINKEQLFQTIRDVTEK